MTINVVEAQERIASHLVGRERELRLTLAAVAAGREGVHRHHVRRAGHPDARRRIRQCARDHLSHDCRRLVP